MPSTAGHVARMGEGSSAFKILTGKPDPCECSIEPPGSIGHGVS